MYAEDYYNWLLGFIEDGEHDLNDYNYILELLFNYEFYEIVRNDCNRVADGLALRNRFADEIGEHLYFVDEDLPPFCTCLEMMIALSYRLEENIFKDPDKGDRTGVWFWVMMRNLGLDWMSDDRYDEAEAMDILRNFVARNYGKNGFGGLFFLKNDRIDMRVTEIWYQAHYFFTENWDEFESKVAILPTFF